MPLCETMIVDEAGRVSRITLLDGLLIAEFAGLPSSASRML
jgi:hypothetical protein